jgi:hypothetical protein
MVRKTVQDCSIRKSWTRNIPPHANRHSYPSKEYSRESQLQKLLPLWPRELADHSLSGVARIVAMLARALRSERCRGRMGHWTYDLCRHAALAEALRQERAALKRLSERAEAREMVGRIRRSQTLPAHP